jgi:glycerol-3-phosphate acyltransferase PlsY
LQYATEIIVIISSYAIGCFTTGYYLILLCTGKDIRKLGSGNVGSKNVGRINGKSGFIITFLGDAGKGTVVALTVSNLQLETWAISLAIIAVVLGHIWPIQLGFRGGKGIATTIGALTVFNWQAIVAFIIIAVIVFVFIRQYIPSSFIAILSVPAASAIIGQPITTVLVMCTLAALILFAHRKDIRFFIETNRKKEGSQ